MSQRALTAGAAASGTAALVPSLNIPVIETLGPLGKVILGGALAWFTYSVTGTTGAVVIGVGVGLLVDGLVDMTIGAGANKVVSA
jgi:hypothetical protein